MKAIILLVCVFQVGKAQAFYPDYDYTKAKPVCKKIFSNFANSLLNATQADRESRIHREDDQKFLIALLKTGQALEKLGLYMKSAIINNCFNTQCQSVLNLVVKNYKTHSEVMYKFVETEKKSTDLINHTLRSPSMQEKVNAVKKFKAIKTDQQNYAIWTELLHCLREESKKICYRK